MQTDIRLGAKVESSEGHHLGEIKHLVMGQNNQLSHIVVGNTALGTGLKQVEAGSIGQLSDDKSSLKLSLDKTKFSQLPDFDEKKFNEGRGYSKDAKPLGEIANDESPDPQTIMSGGYDLDPDANLNPPGLADKQSR